MLYPCFNRLLSRILGQYKSVLFKWLVSLVWWACFWSKLIYWIQSVECCGLGVFEATVSWEGKIRMEYSENEIWHQSPPSPDNTMQLPSIITLICFLLSIVPVKWLEDLIHNKNLNLCYGRMLDWCVCVMVFTVRKLLITSGWCMVHYVATEHQWWLK